MKPADIFGILEREVAPVALSDELCAKYGAYDNSGIILDCGNEVTGAIFCLDLTGSAVAAAQKAGYNLIVTHHPAIFRGIKSVSVQPESPTAALAKCALLGISVISMHLNFDAAPEGIDYYLMEGLGGRSCSVLATIEGGAYGRAYEIAPVTVGQFLKHIESTFRTHRAVAFGNADIVIDKVASFCGAGCDGAAMSFAKAQGVKAFVSSDLKHHEIAELTECGMAVIELTHYSAEAYGFGRIYENVKRQLRVPSSMYYDEGLA